MSKVIMSSDELKFMSILANITDTLAKDCVIDNEGKRVIFIINPGDAGKIIGKGGATIRRVRESLRRDVEIVEHSDSIEIFARNVFNPAQLNNINLVTRKGKKAIVVTVPQKDKGKAIGKAGRVINRAKLLLKRYFDIDYVIVKDN